MVVKGLKVAVMGRRGRVAWVVRARGLVRLSLELVQVPLAGMAPGCILHASAECVSNVVDGKTPPAINLDCVTTHDALCASEQGS